MNASYVVILNVVFTVGLWFVGLVDILYQAKEVAIYFYFNMNFNFFSQTISVILCLYADFLSCVPF